MAIGKSGKVVVELDPDFKRRLHSALAADGLTMKEWLLLAAESYLDSRHQPELPFSATPSGGAR